MIAKQNIAPGVPSEASPALIPRPYDLIALHTVQATTVKHGCAVSFSESKILFMSRSVLPSPRRGPFADVGTGTWIVEWIQSMGDESPTRTSSTTPQEIPSQRPQG